MGTFTAFLRGINVGGHRKISMSDLKQVHAAMQHQNVITHLQSGNVIFNCEENDPQCLIQAIEQEYQKQFGFQVDVILRSMGELAEIIDQCPFSLTSIQEPKLLHGVLLSGVPNPDTVQNLRAYDGPEEMKLIKDTLYVYYANGAARSKLTLALIEKSLKVRGTARNWNTLTKLLELSTKNKEANDVTHHSTV